MLLTEESIARGMLNCLSSILVLALWLSAFRFPPPRNVAMVTRDWNRDGLHSDQVALLGPAQSQPLRKVTIIDPPLIFYLNLNAPQSVPQTSTIARFKKVKVMFLPEFGVAILLQLYIAFI